jgi:hypothetical protein
MGSDFLRRYTDVPALISLLTDRKITLLDPRAWDDSNDSYYLSLYKEKENLKTVLALCFTQAAETYHHWRVFANGSGGVCVQFDRDALLKAVRKVSGIQAEEVTYLKLNEIRGRTLKVADLPFLKRYPFENEDEFRIIYTSSKRTLPALDIPVPLASITRITLSPWLHTALYANLKATLKSIKGCSDLSIIKTTLIGNEEWKKLGEAATHPRPVKSVSRKQPI